MKARQILMAAALTAATMLALPVSAQAAVGVNISVGVAPPPMRYEPVPGPRAGHVWAPGYWAWNGGRHVWQRGHWERARAGYRYDAPRWVRGGDGWRFQQARWQANRHDRAYERGYRQGYRQGNDHDRRGRGHAYGHDRH